VLLWAVSSRGALKWAGDRRPPAKYAFGFALGAVPKNHTCANRSSKSFCSAAGGLLGLACCHKYSPPYTSAGLHAARQLVSMDANSRESRFMLAVARILLQPRACLAACEPNLAGPERRRGKGTGKRATLAPPRLSLARRCVALVLLPVRGFLRSSRRLRLRRPRLPPRPRAES